MPTGAQIKVPASSGPFGANAPSVMLPLRFVLAGILSLLTGVVLLLLRPDALATYHYNQYIISITHLFVLGFVSTIVMGAMYQLVPVALETRLFSERLARWQFLLHVTGFAGMVWMFWKWNLTGVGHFGFVLTIGVLLFGYNIVRTLFRVPRWNMIAGAVASAIAWLLFAVLAGLTIAAGKASYESVSGWYAPLLQFLSLFPKVVGRFDQIAAMHAHAHLGAVGVFLMLIIGISYKLIPMFTLSDVQNPKRASASVLLLNIALAGCFVTILLRNPLKLIFAGMAVSAIGLYLWELKAIYSARKRRAPDWGVTYFLTATGLLVPVCVLALILSWPGLPLTSFTGRLENLYGFLGIAGVIALAIMGMLYKIVPFLVWYRSYSNQIGLRKVPGLADLYSNRIQAIGFWSYSAGLLTSSVAILTGSSLAARVGSGLVLLSLLLLVINLGKILRHLIRPGSAIVTERPRKAGPAWQSRPSEAIQKPVGT